MLPPISGDPDSLNPPRQELGKPAAGPSGASSASMPPDEDKLNKLKQLFPDQAAFIEKAKGRMNPAEIENHVKYIETNYQTWVARNQDLVIKKNVGGGARTIEFLAETGTVVTHFKKKLASGGKGAPLGEGHASVVKSSIVNLSKTFEAGMDIADKKPKSADDVREMVHEGQVTQLFKDAQYVRRVIKVNPGSAHRKMGLLLEGMSGGTLAGKTFDDAQKDAVFSDLTNGLREIHDKSYVHRDLHAANCFLNSQGTAKIGDLGSARETGKMDDSQGNFFTFSPARMRSRIYGVSGKTDPKDDVWSLGLVLYALEHGNPPPFTEKLPELLNMVDNRDKCRAQLDRYPDDIKELIFCWNVKKDPTGSHLQKLQEKFPNIIEEAQAYFKCQEDLCQHFDVYVAEVNRFLIQWQPLNKRDVLVKTMLQLVPSARATSSDACKTASPWGNKASAKVTSIFQAAPVVPSVASMHTAGYMGMAGPNAAFKNTAGFTSGNVSDSFALFPTIFTPKDSTSDSQITDFGVRELKELQKKGIDVVHWKDDHHQTLLHKTRYDSVVDFLLDQGADLNAENLEGKTPLDLAISARNTINIIKLINAGAQVKADSLLNLLSLSGKLSNGGDILKALIDREDLVLPILDLVLEKNDFALFSKIINLDKFAIYISYPDFQTYLKNFLAWAVQQNALPVLDAMFIRCIDLKSVPPDMFPHVLHEAVAAGSRDALVLVKKYASGLSQKIDIENFREPATGRNLLQIALSYPSGVQLVPFLLEEWGFIRKLDEADKDGNTALHYAVKHDQFAIARLLTACGANTLARNLEGKTPAEITPEPFSEVLLDKYHLLKGGPKDKPIAHAHWEWYLNQALLLEQIRNPGLKPEVRNRLAMILLHGFGKAAQFTGISFDVQYSPLSSAMDQLLYHRSTHNPLYGKVTEAYAKELGLAKDEVKLINSPPLLREVFKRSGFLFETVSTEQELKDLIARGSPGQRCFVDLSPLLAATDGAGAAKMIKDICQRLPMPLNLEPIAFTTYQDQDILVLPKITAGFVFYNPHLEMSNRIDNIMALNGLLLSIDQTKEAWLKAVPLEKILQDLGFPTAAVNTGGIQYPRTVCHDFNDFLNQPVVEKFRNLSKAPDAPPYLRVFPEATYRLLQGLTEHRIDQVFAKHGLEALLQITYFRLLTAMHDSITREKDFIAFYNQIELIHNEIQKILAILSIDTVNAYGPDEFEIAAQKRMQPLINPKQLPLPIVHLMPSAMHGLSAILSSVEAQKGKNNLKVVVLKDTYYEEMTTLTKAKNYDKTDLNGDSFRNGSDIQTCLTKTNPDPFDLFLCEFHHNISVDRTSYHPEDVCAQLLAMKDKGLLANPCTVVIDTTLDLERSDQIKKFLSNPQIQLLIKKGELNVQFLRSGQKYDMLGMDNYYGGIVMGFNNPDVFGAFNRRLAEPQDQLKGLSYQGMTHLQKYAGPTLDIYRRAMAENRKWLYSQLPQALIHSTSNTNPIQISEIHDEQVPYLDVKFPNHDKLSLTFFNHVLGQFIIQQKPPCSNRPSFGFAMTNVTMINRDNGEVIRINPGLESRELLQAWVDFFKIVQQVIDGVLATNPPKDKVEDEIIDALKKIDWKANIPQFHDNSRGG